MKKKRKLNIRFILAILFIIASLYLIRSIYIFSRIETLARYFVIIFILVLDYFIFIKTIPKKKKKNGYIFNLCMIIFAFLYAFLGYNLNEIYSYFSGLNKTITYSTSLVTLSSNDNSSVDNVKEAKLGIISDYNSEDGYILAQKIISENNLLDSNELINYDGYHELIMALYNKEVDYIFLPSDYVNIFSTNEGFEDIGSKLKTITYTDKESTKDEAKLLGNSKDISEPFTILLIGIDSTTNNIKKSDSFNGDSLMLVTFNPSTMTATMLSIPRDSYVPIACFNGKYENKITHSAARGTSCVIDTIEDFLDVEIDYYMKINFTGLVDLVDALKGIEVDVPYSFCEQNSKREFGNNMIYVKAGYQTLNGEQALAFSRNRKKNSEYCSKEWTQGYRDDFVRANNQQTVVQAVLNKMKSFDNISSLKNVLKVISNNLDTNMTEDTIFSFYNIAKDMILSTSNDAVLNIQKLYIDGTGQYIYDEATKLQLWNYIPNKQSVEEVKNAMKVNLGLSEHELLKTFDFSVDEEYEPKTIGKGPYKVYTTYDLLVDLTKMSLSEARTWASKNNIELNIEYVQSSKYKNDTIIEQNYPVNKRLDKISGRTVTIKVVKNNTNSNTTTKVDCLEDANNSVCIVPDFISKSKVDVTTWGSKFSNTVALHFEYVESDDTPGTIIGQSVKEGTTVKELVEKNTTLSIKIAKEKTNEETKDQNQSDVDPNEE